MTAGVTNIDTEEQFRKRFEHFILEDLRTPIVVVLLQVTNIFVFSESTLGEYPLGEYPLGEYPSNSIINSHC